MVFAGFNNQDVPCAYIVLHSVHLHDAVPLDYDERFPIRMRMYIRASGSVVRMGSFAGLRESETAGT